MLATVTLSAQAQVPDNAYNYARTSSFTYYQASDGAKSGLLKSETIEPGNAQLCVTTTYTYDAYGNKTGATTANCSGANGRALFAQRSGSSTFAAVVSQAITIGGGTSASSTVAVAIPAGSVATSASNALSQTENRTYDPRFGAALSLTGPNGLTTSWQLDDFGRKIKELRADGTSSVSFYCYLSSADINTSSNTKDCPTPASSEVPPDAVMMVHSEPRNTGGVQMGPFVRTYSDRLGRAIRTVTQSFDGNAQAKGVIAQDVVYNVYGAQVLQTQPYFLASKSSTTATSGDVGATSTEYDVLGRPIKTYTADAAGSQTSVAFGSYGSRRATLSTVSYSALKTIVVNDKGQSRTEEKNAIGELVRVTDPTGAQIAYQRDAFGNLAATKDALQNTVTVVYDIRGRKVSMADPDTGRWDYDYDALGQLVYQQSPNQRAASQAAAQQTTMAYDVLGRMTQRVDPEYTSTWSYDTYANASACPKGIGKLCESNTTNGVNRRVGYDGLGRPLNSRTTITNGPSMTSLVAYDSATGRLASQTYPTGMQVGYGYTSLGYVERLTLLTAAAVAPLPSSPGGTPVAGANLPAYNPANGSGTVLWQARAVNAWGKAEQQAVANGVLTSAAFEAFTGRTASLGATVGNTTVLSQNYSWDSLNNLTGRLDNVGGGNGAVSETFDYGDKLNRLTSYAVSGPSVPGTSRSVSLQYNALGMLLYKSDVGNYTYGAQGANAVRPHALQNVAGTVNASYGYDANGNQTSASGSKYTGIAYTSFNLPDSQAGIAANGPNGTVRYTWLYDENHARVKEVSTTVGGPYAGTVTTWNLHPDNQGGLGFESEVNAPTSPSTANPAQTSNRHYLSIGGQAIGVLVSTGKLPDLTASAMQPNAIASITLVKVEYWHKDHLGSLTATTDHFGNVTQRYAYDPFGKRRFANGVYDAPGQLVYDWNPAVNYGGNRGFTGHEQLDDAGLIHMNGRLFNPTVGAFLQGDPMIQDPANLQNYNRYGYCYNNPLTCTDPTGLSFLSDINPFNVAKYIDPVGHYLAQKGAKTQTGYTIGSIAIGVVSAYYCGAWVGLCNGAGQAAWAGFAGYSDSQALRIGLISGATAQAFYAVGSAQPGYGQANATSQSIAWNTVGHAVVGCASASASGGNCGAGALSAGVASAFGNYAHYSENTIIATMQSAMVGGVSSVVGGGTFSSGAITGSFGYLFNYCMHATGGCLMAWGNSVGNIVGGGLSVVGGVGLCTTGIGCLAGAPTVAIGAGSIGEGIDWLRAGDENIAGQNAVRNAFKSGLTLLGATDTSANFAYGAAELGAAGLALKAPIAIGEKMWTWWGVQSTDGLRVVVPAITTERFRDWAVVKPFVDAAKSTYDALTGK